MVKRTLIATIFAITIISSVRPNAGDNIALKDLLSETIAAFENIAQECEITRSMSAGKAKQCFKDLINRQDTAIKEIKARLKEAYKLAKTAGQATLFNEKKALYRAFKNRIYRVWQETGELPVW